MLIIKRKCEKKKSNCLVIPLKLSNFAPAFGVTYGEGEVLPAMLRSNDTTTL